MPGNEIRAARGLLARAALFAATLLLLAACSFNYGGEEGAPRPDEPSAVFTGFKHVVYRDGARLLELSAAAAEAYDSEGKTLLHHVTFTEYDRSTGQPSAKGRADEVVFYSDTENAEFSGSIHIDSMRDDATLDAEHLSWDGKEKLLSGGLDRTVSVRRGDGSWIRGAGFSADGRRRSIAFREAVEGVVTSSDTEAGAAAASPAPASPAAAPASPDAKP